jgi:hypothetical protein
LLKRRARLPYFRLCLTLRGYRRGNARSRFAYGSVMWQGLNAGDQCPLFDPVTLIERNAGEAAGDGSGDHRALPDPRRALGIDRDGQGSTLDGFKINEYRRWEDGEDHESSDDEDDEKPDESPR